MTDTATKGKRKVRELSRDAIELKASRLIMDWVAMTRDDDQSGASVAEKSLVRWMQRYFPGEVLEDYSGLCVMLKPDGRLTTFRVVEV